MLKGRSQVPATAAIQLLNILRFDLGMPQVTRAEKGRRAMNSHCFSPNRLSTSSLGDTEVSPSRARQRESWCNTLCLLGSVALIVLSSQGCRTSVSAAAAPVPGVQIAEVIQKNVPIYHEYIATLDGYVNAQIQPQGSGYLIKQNYR